MSYDNPRTDVREMVTSIADGLVVGQRTLAAHSPGQFGTFVLNETEVSLRFEIVPFKTHGGFTMGVRNLKHDSESPGPASSEATATFRVANITDEATFLREGYSQRVTDTIRCVGVPIVRGPEPDDVRKETSSPGPNEVAPLFAVSLILLQEQILNSQLIMRHRKLLPCAR